MMIDRVPSYRLSRPLSFDLESAAFKRDPFPTFSAMREAGPVIPVKLPLLGNVWATTTHASTLAMLKDNALFVQEGRHAGKSGVGGMRWWVPKAIRLLSNHMLGKDEPDHRRLRKLVDRAFQRRDIQAMRGDIERIADRILDSFAGSVEVDLVEAFARRLPLEVICDLLGVPDRDRRPFSEWTRVTTSINGPFGLLRAAGPVKKMTSYIREQIEECRRAPRKGLITELVRAEEDGEKLNETELVAMVFLLLLAGFLTTTHLIGDSVIALEQNPDQKAFLLADPASRMERAVEELARYTSPVQSTKPRYVSRDEDFFGQKLKRGDLIVAFVAAANCDPAEYGPMADRLKLDRFPNPHLVFSSGIHFCLGMQLARVEAQSALGKLYGRYPDLLIAAPDQLEWIERFGLRGVEVMDVRLRPSPARMAA